jgi:hypothetical protein
MEMQISTLRTALKLLFDIRQVLARFSFSRCGGGGGKKDDTRMEKITSNVEVELLCLIEREIW